MFKDGFLAMNYYFRPEDLVEIKTCDLGSPVNSQLIPSQQKVDIVWLWKIIRIDCYMLKQS